MTCKLIDTPKLRLGEGTVWKSDTKSLLFVDILGETVYEKTMDSGELRSFYIGGTVGFLVIEDADHIICAKNSDLVRVCLSTGEITGLTDFHIEETLRFNDGKRDKDGRIWAGIMLKEESTIHEKPYKGSLVCIEDGIITSRIDGMRISNGMDWYDGKFYHVDTPTKTIDEYGQNGNQLQKLGVAVNLEDEVGAPDGFCIDENGMAFIAMWGGSCVLVCDIKIGKVVRKIEVPDSCVTCCILGGEYQDKLYISTATDEHGDGGHIYEFAL